MCMGYTQVTVKANWPLVYSEFFFLKIDSYLNTLHIKIRSALNLVVNKDSDSMNYKHLDNQKTRFEVLKLKETFIHMNIFWENHKVSSMCHISGL